jgi:ribosomal protein L9
MKFILSKNINRFFNKGDIVTIIKDWGDLLYISNGFHRVAVTYKDLKVI